MKENKRIEAVVQLGELFRQYTDYQKTKINPSEAVVELDDILYRSEESNGWFTRENTSYSVAQWGALLTRDNLQSWLSNYTLGIDRPKKILIVLAGNIPLVGFHDFLVCYLSGHNTIIKSSSSDAVFMTYVIKKIVSFNPENCVEFSDKIVKDFDAVIATGSDNASRYFEHYFASKPNIIRKNRNSVAVLTGEETPEELTELGEDIFRYYGLGCRSVSKIYVPKNYDFDQLFKAVFNQKEIIEYVKYANNYDYNKAVFLMSEFKLLDNGFLVVKKDESFSSPIGSLFYEEYEDIEKIKSELKSRKLEIQCIVSNGIFDDEIAFGQTQKPTLTDYADHVDTFNFVLSI